MKKIFGLLVIMAIAMIALGSCEPLFEEPELPLVKEEAPYNCPLIVDSIITPSVK